jgi:hypothetical protein
MPVAPIPVARAAWRNMGDQAGAVSSLCVLHCAVYEFFFFLLSCGVLCMMQTVAQMYVLCSTTDGATVNLEIVERSMIAKALKDVVARAINVTENKLITELEPKHASASGYAAKTPRGPTWIPWKCDGCPAII